MSWVKAKLIGETLKDFILCLSIVLAGGWAWYIFFVTERENINPKPIVEVTLKVELISNEVGKYVKSEVTLFNNGNDLVWIELNAPSLSLSTIDFTNINAKTTIVSKQKYQSFKDNAMLTYGDINEILISEESKYILVYLSKVPKTSNKLIQVSFMATYRHIEFRKKLEARNHSKIRVFTTQAKDYISL